MEELDIYIESLEIEAQDILIKVDRLNDFGNTPKVNYELIHQLLTKWGKMNFAIESLKNVKYAIESNRIAYAKQALEIEAKDGN